MNSEAASTPMLFNLSVVMPDPHRFAGCLVPNRCMGLVRGARTGAIGF
jgi:hypothetical protein